MATISASATVIDANRVRIVWTGAQAGDTLLPAEVSAVTWRSVSWAGTLAGFGASASFEESNDGVNWLALVSWPSANRCVVLDGRARYLRPNIANLGVGDSVDFYLFCSQQP